MGLSETIEAIGKTLRAGTARNESAVREVLVLPVLAALGWPVGDPHVVAREHDVKGRRVDYALFAWGREPEILIEVKAVGNTKGADRQLFEYAYHFGIPLAILTDGREWSFFLPQERGDPAERLLRMVDALDGAADEAAGAFNRYLARYLAYERVLSGAALDDARLDYKELARGKRAENALPEAWNSMLTDPPEG